MFIRTISRWASILSSAILLFTILAGASANGSSTIQITAVPSSFTPNRIVMHVGQTTTLEFNHTKGVHDIASSDLGIPNTILSADDEPYRGDSKKSWDVHHSLPDHLRRQARRHGSDCCR